MRFPDESATATRPLEDPPPRGRREAGLSASLLSGLLSGFLRIAYNGRQRRTRLCIAVKEL